MKLFWTLNSELEDKNVTEPYENAYVQVEQETCTGAK